MKKMKLILAQLIISASLFSQGWVGNSTNNSITPYNSSLGLSPMNVGIGLNTPSEQLHTTAGVRFTGLTQLDTPSRVIVQDNTGKLFWRNANTFGSGQAWNIKGNSGTNPTTDFLGTQDNQRLVFRTNNTEKATILTNGNIGVNQSNPTHKLEIRDSINPDRQFAISGLSPSIHFSNKNLISQNAPTIISNNQFAKIGMATANGNFVTTSIPGDLVLQTIDSTNSIIFSSRWNSTILNGIEHMRLNSNGNLGIGTTNPMQRLTVFNGTSTGTYTTTGWTHSSDLRLKENISDIEDALNIVKKLNGKYYTWKDNKGAGRQVGFIAQDVQKILPEVVVGIEGDIEKGETLGMAYQNIVPVLVEAIKELNTKVEKQNNVVIENEALKAKINTLEEKFELLEKSLTTICESGCAGLDKKTTEVDVLYQSIPNPTDDIALINYYLASDKSNAEIRIYMSEGQTIETFKLDTKQGNGSVKVSLGNLASGTYLYTLIANGKVVDTKRIQIVT